MKLLFAALIMSLSLFAEAKVIKMAVITSEFDHNVRDYYLEIDEKNEIHSMRYVTTMPNGGIAEDVTVTPEEVKENGIVVFEHRGYKAVILELENFDIALGGTIKVNYLFSGVSNTRHARGLTLKKVNEEFQLFDQDKRINKMFFELNRSRIFGPIGVKTIHTSFEPELTL